MARPRRCCDSVVQTLFLGLLFWSSPGYASVLGLAPPEPPLRHPYEALSRDELFAEIDRHEQLIHDTADASASQARLELGILLTATGRPEDRQEALDHFRLAYDHAPERLDILLWWARTHWRSHEHTPARLALEGGADRFADSAELAYARGYIWWQNALRHLDPEAFQRARTEFVRAAQLNRDPLPHRIALAASGLATQDYAATLAATTELIESGRAALPVILGHAIALAHRDDEEEADRLFRRAIQVMPEELASAFVTGAGLLPGLENTDAAAADLYWRAIDPHPTQTSNQRQLEFWQRLVEADLFFGGVEPGVPAWQTGPGEAWVRWGRPSRTLYDPAELQASFGRTSPQPGSETPRGVDDTGQNQTRRSDLDPNQNRWSWIYAYGGRSFQLTFTDITFNNRWAMSNASQEQAHAVTQQTPVIFASRAVVSTFDLEVALAGFVRGDDERLLETAIAVVPRTGADGTSGSLPPRVDVEWAFYDRADRRIDHGSLTLGSDRSRLGLLASLPASAAAAGVEDALLGLVPARLRPGGYRVAVEATDPASGAHRWAVSEVTLGTRSGPELLLSDLQLTASYAAYAPGSAIPPEFVKHAQVLIPTPGHQIKAPQHEMFVYYEIYDLAHGEDGLTHFNVRYDIFPAGGGEPAAPGPGSTFLEERTGLSEGGFVVKGTKLDVSTLTPGTYELRVTVEDRIGLATSSQSTTFRVMGDAES